MNRRGFSERISRETSVEGIHRGGVSGSYKEKKVQPTRKARRETRKTVGRTVLVISKDWKKREIDTGPSNPYNPTEYNN